MEWRSRDARAPLANPDRRRFQPLGDGVVRLLAQEAALSIASPRARRNGQALAEETWAANELLDKLGLYTTEVYQKAREEVIIRQQQEMLELSTPVVKLWEGILALADDRHARQRPHPGRDGDPAAEDRRDRARASPSSTSRACRRSTR